MGAESRLNLLLTHQERDVHALRGQAWYQTLHQLLAPLGVRTFEATSGTEAVDLIERHPIHLAVVDWQLPTISGMNVLQLIQKLQEQAGRFNPPSPPPSAPSSTPAQAPGARMGFRLQMNVEEHTSAGQTRRRIEVKIDSGPAPTKAGPAVILIAPPQQSQQMLQEALKFNAFSVMSEPVDVNLLLEVMARAMKRFHQNHWPA